MNHFGWKGLPRRGSNSIIQRSQTLSDRRRGPAPSILSNGAPCDPAHGPATWPIASWWPVETQARPALVVEAVAAAQVACHLVAVQPWSLRPECTQVAYPQDYTSVVAQDKPAYRSRRMEEGLAHSSWGCSAFSTAWVRATVSG